MPLERLRLPADMPNRDFDVWIDRSVEPPEVLKRPRADRTGPHGRNDALDGLDEPTRLARYAEALCGASRLPFLGPHVCAVLHVAPGGAYRSPFLEGPGPEAAGSEAFAELFEAFAAWERERGPLPGDWHPNNLVLHAGRLVNVDVEGFWNNADGSRPGLSTAGVARLRILAARVGGNRG